MRRGLLRPLYEGGEPEKDTSHNSVVVSVYDYRQQQPSHHHGRARLRKKHPSEDGDQKEWKLLTNWRQWVTELIYSWDVPPLDFSHCVLFVTALLPKCGLPSIAVFNFLNISALLKSCIFPDTWFIHPSSPCGQTPAHSRLAQLRATNPSSIHCVDTSLCARSEVHTGSRQLFLKSSSKYVWCCPSQTAVLLLGHPIILETSYNP